MIGAKEKATVRIQLVLPSESELLTTGELARILSVAQDTLKDWRQRGQGPPFMKLSRHVLRYPRKNFIDWLHAHLQGGVAQEAKRGNIEELVDKLKFLQ